VESYREIGKRLSNWGRWGADDERGTLNFITAEKVKAAAESIKSGKVFELSIPIQTDAPPWNGMIKRTQPVHLMSSVPLPDADRSGFDGMFGTDDWIIMPLQATTQWDGLSHVGYDDYFYNNVHISAVTGEGASKNSIDNTMPGMVGRGVLLDIAKLRGVDWLPGGHAITPEELEEAEQAQGVKVGSGDCLLLRTGWRLKAVREGWDGWLREEPGIGIETAQWLYDREVAAIACDNHAVEVEPTQIDSPALPLHGILIRDMGMPLGEIFDFEELAADCAADGQYSFFFSAPPLRVTDAVGSPVSPIAVK
jgi:kynurenine formamidase